MDVILKYGVIVSFLICLVSLTVLVLKTFSFGKKKLYAEPAGNVKKGIVYAIGKGMMPWEKESAKNHLLSYMGGILYHVGVFVAFLYLLAVIAAIDLPKPVVLIVRAGVLVGFAAGVVLLLKRIFSPHMRALSCPDDAAANIIVDVFIISVYFHTLFPEITPYFYLGAIIMFLYIPFGKIRHCFFFFYVRILFGMFYGRRGVFPQKPHEV
jgi:nitrate reductase gamma subunit